MFRTISIAAMTLIAGIGIGVASNAGADQPAGTSATKTPVSCLLALEDAWKTINPVVADGVDHKAGFDRAYAECLEAS